VIYPILNPSPRWEGLLTSGKIKAPLGGFGGKSLLLMKFKDVCKII